MLSVIIIEDELIASEYLEKLIHQYDSSIKVIAKIDSVESAVAFLNKNTADLIFCDIHLSDDISFNIFSQVDVTIPVIFTTAYDQYAIRAFKLNSIDYLLKPINKEELFAAMIKFEAGRKDNFPDIKNILSHFSQQTTYQQRFLVSSGSKLKSVAIEDVAYFFADQKLNFLVETSGKQYIIDHALDKLEPMLNPNDFFRINRQFIIRFTSIAAMTTYSKSRIKIELQPACDKETIVSVDRSPEFKAWLNR